MDLHRREFNKNKIIVPVLMIMLIAAGYAAHVLSKTMRPMTLDEYERRYSIPEFPAPINRK